MHHMAQGLASLILSHTETECFRGNLTWSLIDLMPGLVGVGAGRAYCLPGAAF